MDLFSLERLVGKVPIPHPEFQHLEEEVLRCVKRTSAKYHATRTGADIEMVRACQVPPYSDILAIAETHAHIHGRPVHGDALLLVHPLYALLTDYPLYEVERYGVESRASVCMYLDRLVTLLEARPLPVVVFETPHHYGMLTAYLLERRVIDRVLFTGFDNGTPLRYDALQGLLDGRLFVGGGYNVRCLASAYDALDHAGMDFSRVWALPEITLDKNDHAITLYPQVIRGPGPKSIPTERHVKLSSLIPSAGS